MTELTLSSPYPLLTQGEDIELHEIRETYSTTGNEETLTHDPFSEDILKIDGQGFCGFLERIPLPIKLILMGIISVIGVIILGALLINAQTGAYRNSALRDKFLSAALQVNQLSQSLDTECHAVLQYLHGSTIGDDSVVKAFSTTNIQIVQYKSAVDSFKSAVNDDTRSETYTVLNDIDALSVQLQVIRENYQKNTTRDLMTYYNLFKSKILTALTQYKNNLNLADSYVVSLLLYEILLRHTRELRNFGVNGLHTRSIFSESAELVRMNEIRKSIAKDFEATAFINILHFQNKLVIDTGFEDLTNLFIFSVVNNRTIEGVRVSAGDFDYTFTILIDAYEKVHNELILQIRKNVQEDLIGATVNIVVAIVLPIVFFILAIISVYLLSVTITGPWRRLNRIQETAIKKFVPSRFLTMIKCKAITDVYVGKYAKTDITMVRAIIKKSNSNVITDDSYQVQNLNKVFDFLGPIIRKNNGFIDQYAGDGFIALFKDVKAGVSACVNMQVALRSYNSIPSNTEISIVTVIHTAEVIIGAIGENDRVNGAIISDEISVLQRATIYALDNLPNCKIIATSAVRSTRKGLQSRYVGNNGGTEIYEVMETVETEKLRIQDTFSQASKLLYDDKDVVEALSLFETIQNDDVLAQEKVKLCKKKLSLANRISENWRIKDTLHTEILNKAFHNFCDIERSTENIDVWNEVQRYRAVEQEGRKELATHIVQKYFNNMGDDELNISEGVKSRLNKKMEQDVLSEDMFDELQYELEILMNDTHKRFKENPKFLNSICKLME